MVSTERMSSNALVAVPRKTKVKSKEAWSEVPFEEKANEIREDFCLDWSLFGND